MVSILMCTYNREGYLKRAIDSVIGQTYTKWELIIVDDGSTDRSKEVILSYEDPRIIYVPMEQNRFYCYAANYGLPYCSGQYVAFLNSDDEWTADKLQKQAAFMKEHQDYGACFTGVTLIDDNGKNVSGQCKDMKELFETRYDTQEEWMRFFLFHGNCLCHPSALIRRELLRGIGGFNLMYCQLADYDLWIRIVTQTLIHVIPECLTRFRWDVEQKEQISSVTTLHIIRSYNELAMIREQMVERLTDEQFLRFFHREFRNAKSASHLQLEFEKAFLLMRCMTETPEIKVLGIRKMERLLREEGAVAVLEEHFQMRLQDIYEWNEGHWYIDPVIISERNSFQQTTARLAQCEAELARQEEELEKSREVILQKERETDEWKKLVQAYHTSASWRCTEPLRKMKALLGHRKKFF